MGYSLLAVLLLPSFAQADAAILAQRPAVSAKNKSLSCLPATFGSSIAPAATPAG